MIAVLTLIGGLRGVAVALAAGLISGLFFYNIGHWRGDAAGRAAERAEALRHSMDLIRDRSDTNAKIDDLDDAELCRALGGRWVLPDNVCQ